MNRLARLLQFTRYFRWAFAAGQITADGFLLFREIDSRMLQGGSCQVLELAILAASIIIQVIGREEPPVYNTHTRYASSLYEMHKMPVTQVELFSSFMRSQHTIQML